MADTTPSPPPPTPHSGLRPPTQVGGSRPKREEPTKGRGRNSDDGGRAGASDGEGGSGEPALPEGFAGASPKARFSRRRPPFMSASWARGSLCAISVVFSKSLWVGGSHGGSGSRSGPLPDALGHILPPFQSSCFLPRPPGLHGGDPFVSRQGHGGGEGLILCRCMCTSECACRKCSRQRPPSAQGPSAFLATPVREPCKPRQVLENFLAPRTTNIWEGMLDAPVPSAAALGSLKTSRP